MKKNILQCLSVLLATLIITQPVTALAASEYSFSSGDETGFGKTSSVDMDYLINPTSENVRRDKNVTYFAPEYGVFSGEIPTDQTSLYHALLEMDTSDTNTRKGGNTSSTIQLPEPSGALSASENELSESLGTLRSTSVSETLQTLPWEYADGSIGTLSGSKLGSIKVYEGETNESMRKGAGHFTYTSAWAGNAAFAGHNRGSSAFFAGIKDLVKGDKITYTTQYGKRSYQVFLKVKIMDTDTSYLSWSDENIITMITCVANEPSYRWCVQAREIKEIK